MIAVSVRQLVVSRCAIECGKGMETYYIWFKVFKKLKRTNGKWNKQHNVFWVLLNLVLKTKIIFQMLMITK